MPEIMTINAAHRTKLVRRIVRLIKPGVEVDMTTGEPKFGVLRRPHPDHPNLWELYSVREFDLLAPAQFDVEQFYRAAYPDWELWQVDVPSEVDEF